MPKANKVKQLFENMFVEVCRTNFITMQNRQLCCVLKIFFGPK